MTKPRQSLAEMKSQLRAATPMNRLIRYEDWIEQNAPLMIELGFESELGRLREEAADIRANLESSGGAASPKDQLRMAQWQSEQLKFVLAADLVTQRRRAYGARTRKAKDGLSAAHDWSKVAAQVKALRASGVPECRIAAKINERFGIPQSTFRDWKRKQKNDG